MKQKRFGFTLIEILVVISIISVLAGALYANFADARAESRDKVRKNTLLEMQVALELYKSQYGVYPEQGCGAATTWTGPGPHSAVWANNIDCPEYIVGLAPTFISALPIDPGREYQNNTGYLYQVNGTRTAYKLLSYGTVESDTVDDYNHDFSRCPTTYGSTQCGATPESNTYAVYSFGAEDW